jgi:hypothetical protein
MIQSLLKQTEQHGTTGQDLERFEEVIPTTHLLDLLVLLPTVVEILVGPGTTNHQIIQKNRSWHEPAPLASWLHLPAVAEFLGAKLILLEPPISSFLRVVNCFDFQIIASHPLFRIGPVSTECE